MGPAGSGKGVQSKLLASAYSIPHISTGTLLRSRAEVDDNTGNTINSLISNGNLVPDDLLYDIVQERLNNADCKNGFILDGYPRTLKQAEEFSEKLQTSNGKDPIVLVLKVPDEIVIKRISGRYNCKTCKAIYNKFFELPKIDGVCDVCGGRDFVVRSDDTNMESIKKRLDIYRKTSKQIEDYYIKKGLIYFVDGTKLKGKIHEDIKNILNSY